MATAAKNQTDLDDDAAPVTISGVVRELKCAKPTFCAGHLYSGGRLHSFSVKGYVEPNKPATLRGRWETHPKWGRQFKGTEVVYEMPADPDGMAAWLASAIDGMGPVKAREMVDAFGADLPRMLAQDPEAIAILIPRTPIELVKRTAVAWHAAADRAALGTALYAYGLTQHEVEQLIARYKGSAKTILETDPYLILGDLPGFGWKRVDAIGAKVGVPRNHPGRIRAAVITAVREELDNGSTCVSQVGAVGAAEDLLKSGVIAGEVEAGLADALAKRLLTGIGDEAVALPGAVRAEKYLWERFRTASDPNPCFRKLSAEDLEEVVSVKRVVQYRGEATHLDDSQVDAVRLAISHRFVAVTGGAGAGKTLVAKAIYEALQLGTRPLWVANYNGDTAWKFHEDYQKPGFARPSEGRMSDEHETPPVALCAPTGKAARRLQEVIGKEAGTIHRLLGWNPETGRFMHDQDLTLSYDAIIVDEASMIDAQLLESLLRAVGPDTAVIFIGDDNQLPPVGPGYPLRDILEHKLIPFHRLTKCHRQAGTLKHNCVKIIEDGIVEPSCLSEGDPGPWLVHRQLETPERVLAAVEKLFAGLLAGWENPFGLSYGPIMNHQFVTARHDGPLGTKKLNELLQRLAQARLGVKLAERPADETLPLLIGDKVIQTKNNYTINVMNGTIGTVVNDSPLTVLYDDREVPYTAEQKYDVSLAYCLSVHKMQGSEVPCVIVICPNSHSFMQHRSWLYTACTRAQFTCVVIGDNNGIRRAGEGKSKERRRTILELFATVPEVRPPAAEDDL